MAPVIPFSGQASLFSLSSKSWDMDAQFCFVFLNWVLTWLNKNIYLFHLLSFISFFFHLLFFTKKSLLYMLHSISSQVIFDLLFFSDVQSLCSGIFIRGLASILHNVSGRDSFWQFNLSPFLILCVSRILASFVSHSLCLLWFLK